MKYGLIAETKTLDENGSTVKAERNYVSGMMTKPVRRYYEYRTKVTNKKDEMMEYMKFSDSLTEDKLDPAFRIERSKHGDEHGYYFAVKCYTILDYIDAKDTI